MKAAISSSLVMLIYQTASHNIPEDHNSDYFNMLQAGRLWVQIPTRQFYFSVYLIFAAALWPWC
jgi:hypothetical protein